jgi:hypothetical protein
MRLHAENPELTYEELVDLATRTSSAKLFAEDEPRYEYECRQCQEQVFVTQAMHDRFEYYKTHTDEVGSRSPKCGACYA